MKAYKSKRIYTPLGIKDGYLLVDNDKIVDILKEVKQDVEVVDYSDYMLLPGIIDVHNHGFAGWSMTDEIDVDGVMGYQKALASVGVTSVCATAKLEAFKSIAKVIDDDLQVGTRILGIHSEGPFWARGGENTVGETWPKPNVELAKKYIDEAEGKMIVMAIAPELEGASEVIKLLHEHNIKVAACHTKANSSQIKEALDNGGFDIVTHLCNGMQGIHHRDVGALGQFLLTDNIYYELIADLNHVCADMIRLIFKVVGYDRVVLISDSNYMANMPIGKYERYGKEMYVDEMGLIKDKHGRICGSGKYVLYNMKQLINNCDVCLEDAIQMASLNPAKYLGIENITGSLKYGKLADFIVVDDDLNCKVTYVSGNKVYDENQNVDLINPDAYKRKVA